MTQLFGHEKLKVYQKSMGFVSMRRTLAMTRRFTSSHTSSFTLRRLHFFGYTSSNYFVDSSGMVTMTSNSQILRKTQTSE